MVALVVALSSRCRRQSGDGNDRQSYAFKICETYNFRFGRDKWHPRQCRSRRQRLHPARRVSQSGILRTLSSGSLQPVAPGAAFQFLSHALLSRQRQHFAAHQGIEFTRHCDSCHNPIGVLSGALTQDSQVDRGFDEDGVTCTTCHSIQKLQSTNGNGGFVMGVPSAMVDEDGNRIPGIVPDEEIRRIRTGTPER